MVRRAMEEFSQTLSHRPDLLAAIKDAIDCAVTQRLNQYRHISGDDFLIIREASPGVGADAMVQSGERNIRDAIIHENLENPMQLRETVKHYLQAEGYYYGWTTPHANLTPEQSGERERKESYLRLLSEEFRLPIGLHPSQSLLQISGGAERRISQ